MTEPVQSEKERARQWLLDYIEAAEDSTVELLAAYASEGRRETTQEDEYDQKARNVIKNLAMLVRRLCHRLHKHEPDTKMIDQALGYLRGEGLQGSILREESVETPEAAYRRGRAEQLLADINLCVARERDSGYEIGAALREKIGK